jgi:class 3 adenylate cyclase/predicted ATPase
MECQNCKAKLSEGSKFCTECGTPLPLGCPSCGHGNPLRAKFCAECGAKLIGASKVPAETPAESSTPETSARSSAERRQLTVMFCDLVGSTALSTQLDPEDLGNLIGDFRTACTEAVARFGGSVAKYMGDGALIYFGYPEAYEDAAVRAILAGLALVEAAGVVRQSSPGFPQLRIGIATGTVVVGELIGEGASHERVAVGETLNLAARLQALAAPDSVVISESTWNLTGAAFNYDDLGPQMLKGISTPVRAWAVVAENSAESRFAARTKKGMTPLVGRGDEIGMMRQRWEHALEGDGQIILLSAPPGMGKSRMTQAFRDGLGETQQTSLQFFCSPYHANSPLYPFVRQLEFAAGFDQHDPPDQKLDKLEAALEGAADVVAEAAPLLAALLSIPYAQRYPQLETIMSELVRKQRTLHVLEEQLALLSGRGPLLVVFEDVHWADPTSIELMGRILRRVADLPAMVIANFRPEFAPPWLGLGNVTLLTLSQLSRRRAKELIGKAADGVTFPNAVIDQIVAKAQGVPLFVEEITRSVLASGILDERDGQQHLKDADASFIIPATLQDRLVARLDRLGPAKDVALAASIVGPEFSLELIGTVLALEPSLLAAALEQLVRSDIVAERGEPPNAIYTFKHALIRDAAYQTVLKSRKRDLHRRVAETLESRFPDVARSEPEVLAHHYTEADVTERALHFWCAAAAKASASLAHAEATGHIRRALALIAALPEGPARDEWELAFLTLEGPARMALEGWDSPAAHATYDRARLLAGRLDRMGDIFRSLWGLWMGAHSAGRHAQARPLLDEMCELLETTEKPEYVVQAHHAAGSQMHAEGKLRRTTYYTGRCLSAYRTDTDGNLAMTYGAHDPGCCSLGMEASALLMLGYPDQAHAASLKALSLGRQVEFQTGIAHTSLYRAGLCIMLNEPGLAAESIGEALEISERFKLGPYLLPLSLCDGWVRAFSGNVEEGLRRAEQALAAIRASPTAKYQLPMRTAFVGQIRLAAGDPEGALTLFADALELARSNGELFYVAEILRLTAQALLARPNRDRSGGERCLHEALETARGQEAKFWELRAASALARLWSSEGRQTEALSLVTPVYSWFTEGFDTLELRSAKALVAELQR